MILDNNYIISHSAETMAAVAVQPSQNWGETTPAPHTRSCIKLGCSAEPCVNKAVSHLHKLKERLSKEQRKSIREKTGFTTLQTSRAHLGVEDGARAETAKTKRDPVVDRVGLESANGLKSGVLFGGSELVVEGVRTGERLLGRGAGEGEPVTYPQSFYLWAYRLAE